MPSPAIRDTLHPILLSYSSKMLTTMLCGPKPVVPSGKGPTITVEPRTDSARRSTPRAVPGRSDLLSSPQRIPKRQLGCP